MRAEVDALHRAGVTEAEWVDDPALPFPTSGAVRLADQLQVDPVELVDALAADARAHGVTIAEGARVRGVHGHSPGRVVTDAGDARARTVVLATNMPILDRGGFFARAEPARSYSVAFRTRAPAVDGMYLSADQPSRSLRDAPDADADDSLLPHAVETHAWSAQDYLPHHALPYAGPLLPGAEGILVAGGYSKWGMTNGVAAALAVSGRILGGHLEWASVFEPWSTRELSGLPGGLRVNAGVAVELTMGWFHKVTGAVTGSSAERPVCTHLGGVLRWNDAEESWDCPLHGSRFGPDGQVLEGPATCPVQSLAAEHAADGLR